MARARGGATREAVEGPAHQVAGREARRGRAAPAGGGWGDEPALGGGVVGDKDGGARGEPPGGRPHPRRVPPLRGGETRRPNRVRRDSHCAPLSETARSIGEA